MKKTGNQTPRVHAHGDYTLTAGTDAVMLADNYGLTADEWQVTAAETILAEYKNGRLVHKTAGLAVPRQNGKNGVLELIILYKTVIQERRVLHTAHEVKTARSHAVFAIHGGDRVRYSAPNRNDTGSRTRVGAKSMYGYHFDASSR